MRRRGFTLLELVLAMALGTVIVGVAWGLMVSVDRADRSIEAAGNDSLELERARLVMTRMSSSILMAPGSDPRKLAAREEEEKNDAERSRTRRRNPSGIRPDDPLPTPRIMLAPDPGAGGVMVPERTSLDASLLTGRLVPSGGAGVGVVPQRLEIVLVDPPVPTTVDRFEAARRVAARHLAKDRRASEGGEEAEALAETAAEVEEDPDVAVRAFRGVFQFRPEEYTAEEQLRIARGEFVRPRWRLEWQALLPRGTYAQDASPPEAVLDGPPRVIARDLVYANWLFFDNGERKTNFEGTWGSDLPAYAELELETVRGVQVNWMFEVGWAFGPEVPPPTPNLSRFGRGASSNGNDSDSKDASPSPAPGPDGKPEAPRRAPRGAPGEGLKEGGK